MINLQLPHSRSDQISDYKHDIYLHGKLSTNLLPQASNKNVGEVHVYENWMVAFFLSMVSEMTPRKSSKQTLS